MKVGYVIRILEKQGFRLVRQRGSHRRFKGVVNGKTRLVTVAGKKNDDLIPATLASIQQQSGLQKHLFR